MKFLAVLLLLSVVSFAQVNLNWTGGIDSSAIAGFKADSLKFSKPFILSNGENKLAYVVCDDTSAAGHNDSIKFHWGYQVGWQRKISATAYDTVWSNGIFLDTFKLDNAYNPNTLTGGGTWFTDSLGATYARTGQVDTVSLTGFSTQWASMSPPWAPYIRFYFKGMTGNKVGRFNKLQVCLLQRKNIIVGY